MKFMIAVACLALACGAHASGWAGPPANIALSQDGRNILDTPEVAQARASHLAALQQAAQNNPNPQDDGSYDPRWDNEEYWQRAEQPKWNAAPAQSWNSAPAQSWNAAPAQSWNAAPQWNGAPAAPAWNAAGQSPAPVAETPEVAQARAAHLAALSAAKSAAPAQQQWNAPAQQQQWNAPSHQQWNAPAPQWNGAPSWQGQPAHQSANIRLANDGSGILDTPEVAAARAAHLAAHQQAAHAAPPAHAPQQRW
ncbi:pupal cuticle protein-like [Achroia grisella]|uniref:pupal cuticle protein-like n=1 Tax=Achroia grisella TaxID=688607 RepID=UPI0027D26D7B|nr:pupal cuticle protein-like [Achroia grisella]